MGIAINEEIIAGQIYSIKSGTSNKRMFSSTIVPPNTIGSDGDSCEHINGTRYLKVNNVWTVTFQPLDNETIALALEKLGTINNPFLFKGEVLVAGDFPSLAVVENGWTYTIKADVVDNSVGKTNTGLSFKLGDEITWDGSSWVIMGGNATLTNLSDSLEEIQGYLGGILLPSKVIYVDGSRTNDGLTEITGNINFPFKTIAAAIEVATSGDLIKVINKGTPYEENIVLPAGVSIEGNASNNTVISGTITTTVGNPISIRYLQLDNTLTINCATSILDVFTTGKTIVNDSVVQGYNFHMIAGAKTALEINGATSKFQSLMSTISSTGAFNTIIINNGKLIVNTVQISGNNAGTPVLMMNAGIINLLESSVLNTGGGVAINGTNSTGVTSNPNMIHGVLFLGNVILNTSVSHCHNTDFISGSLSGSSLITNTKEFSNIGDIVATTGTLSIVHNLGKQFLNCLVFYKPESGDFSGKWINASADHIIELLDENTVKFYNTSSEIISAGNLKVICSI